MHLGILYSTRCSSPILMKLEFCRHIFKDNRKPISMTTCLVGAELFHEEGKTNRRTDITEIIVAFRNY